MNNKRYSEHEQYKNGDIFIPKCITKDKYKKKIYFNDNERFGYFIGAMWLHNNNSDNRTSVIVQPKLKDIDFTEMFIKCLSKKEIVDDFHKIYHIYFDESSIKYKDVKSLPNIEPLLLIHYIFCIKQLIKKRLKFDFITTERNCSTVKGKLLFHKHLTNNIMKQRSHKAFCQFTEHDINCIENRILKKALLICKKYFTNTCLNINTINNINNDVNTCLLYFQGISDKVSPDKLKSIKINPLFKEYKNTISIAIKIIKFQRYTESNNMKSDHIGYPPHWINMPLLFEKYVYSLMLDNTDEWGNILYQQKFQGNIPDFLIPKHKLIADAKYKILDESVDTKVSTEDIRQLSGYARHFKIRESLGYSQDDIDTISCLIIYPKKPTNPEKEKGLTSDQNLWDPPNKNYIGFYTVGVKIPMI